MPTQRVTVKPSEGDNSNKKDSKPPLLTRKSKIFSISEQSENGFQDGFFTGSKDIEAGKEHSKGQGRNYGNTNKNAVNRNGKLNEDKAMSKAQEAGVTVGVVPQPFNPLMYRDRVSWWAVLYTAIPDSVGVSGVKYALNVGENRARRLFWILLIASGFGLTCYQVVDRIQFYVSYPKNVDIAINHQDQIPLPAVAICNNNQYRREFIEGTAFGYLVSEWSQTNIFPSGWEIDFSVYEPWLNGTNMTDLILQLAHTVDDTVMQVKLGSTLLTNDNFTVKFTDFGICYTFNSGEDGRPPVYIKASGTKFGFSLILNVQQDYYFYEELNRYSAGFHVILYERGTEPVEDLGFAIQPGTGTLVAFETKEITNLPPPHGECEDKDLSLYSYYGLPECYLECMSDYIVSQCGCRATFLPGNAPVCDPIQYFKCGGRAYGEFLEQRSTACDCPVPCFYRSYTPHMSYNAFPSNYWAELLASAYFADQNLTASYFTENMMYINIFVKDLAIEEITQIKAYDFFSLMCDIGGSLGLWLGGSVLTIFEFMDLFGHSIYVYSKRIPRDP